MLVVILLELEVKDILQALPFPLDIVLLSIFYLFNNIVYIVAVSFIFISIYGIYHFISDEKKDEWKNTYKKMKKSHGKKAIYILISLIVLASSGAVGFYVYENNHFPEPPEDKLVIAISPFYAKDLTRPDLGYDVANEFKELIENQNLGIEVKLKNIEPIADINNAKSFGKNNGAHIVVYGNIKFLPGNSEEITYNILPLENLKIKPSIENATYFQNKFTEDAVYHTTQDDTIQIRQKLEENASSVVYAIAAFKKYEKSQFQQSAELFKSIKNYHDDEIILYYIANCYLFDNKFNESLQYFGKAIVINTKFIDALNNKGIALAALGDYEEALVIYENILKNDSQNLYALVNKGNALLHLGRYEEALEAYDNATNNDPNSSSAWYNKGNAFAILGRYEEALEAYDNATNNDPNSSSAWNNKGNTLSILGRYDEALEAYDNATDIDPNFFDAWFNKGSMLYDIKKFEDALEAFDDAINIFSQDSETWFKKGNALFHLDRYDEALEAYDNATDINPNYLDAWYNKGLAFAVLGKNDEERLCLVKVEELSV